MVARPFISTVVWTPNGLSELRSCVKVEVAVLGFPSLPEPYGFRGRKVILTHAHALVSACPQYVSPISEDMEQHRQQQTGSGPQDQRERLWGRAEFLPRTVDFAMATGLAVHHGKRKAENGG